MRLVEEAVLNGEVVEYGRCCEAIAARLAGEALRGGDRPRFPSIEPAFVVERNTNEREAWG
jgi:hypothetical protein